MVLKCSFKIQEYLCVIFKIYFSLMRHSKYLHKDNVSSQVFPVYTELGVLILGLAGKLLG